MEAQTGKYIQVIVPLKLEWNPWYSTGSPVQIGGRVSVSLQGRKYIGVVCAVSDSPLMDPDKVVPVLDANPGLDPISLKELELWEFIAQYYLCTLGEVYRAAYPALKTRSEKTLKRKIAAALEDAAAAAAPEGGKRPFEGKPVVLKKTDRIPEYIRLCNETLKEGRGALVLVPEIEDSLALEDAFRKAFSQRLKVYNSLKTYAQRGKVAKALRDAGQAEVILATRSALFLPFRDLGLVIVDREQSQSYKQSEPSPRYNARDVAVMLSKIHGASLVLGSSAPSLETLLNCRLGKYRLEEDEFRCRAELIDITSEKRKRGVCGLFTFKAIEALRRCKEQDRVIIIRGYEKQEDIYAQVKELFPGLDPGILTSHAALKAEGKSALTLVLQADSLFGKEDFRADEKAWQTLLPLSLKTERLIVQTSNPERPVYRALERGEDPCEALLSERREFRLPPYTRLVDVRKASGSKDLVCRVTLDKDADLAQKKKKIFEKYAQDCILDVDPL